MFARFYNTELTRFQFKMYAKIYVATLNVRTLRKEEDLTELIYALGKIKWDIVGVSEVRRVGESIVAHPDYLLYHIGETPGQYGVGFIIKKQISEHVEEFIGISERIAIINIKLPGYKDPWSIAQIYSPTEQAKEEIINKFYLDLNQAIIEHCHKNLIVLGDFNGQIGERRPGEESTVGSFTYNNKIRSKNGERVIQFALENNLTILNTVYRKNKKKMWTWITPDGKHKNEIDFIMTNKTRYFRNFDVIKNLNYNTDHKLLRAELMTRQPKNIRPRQCAGYENQNYDTEQITNGLKETFANFEDSTKELGAQEKYNWIENGIKIQIKSATNTKKEAKKNLSTNTVNLLEERYHLINARYAPDRRKKLTKISKEIKSSIRKDRKQNRRETIEKHIIKTGGIKKAYRELQNSKNWIVKMKDDKEIWNRRRTDMLSIATTYYKKLYTHNTDTDEEVDLEEISDVPKIITSEVKKAIETQKDDKAPGPDGISNEMLKQSKDVMIPVLTDIFNDIISTEIIPHQWLESNIILLYKKGDKYDIANYRPISLMSNLYKIFSKIILKRIEGTLEEHQPIEQAGFRKGYSVIDHIHVARQIIEKYNEYNLTYYIAFIDYSKAFDSLIHGKIWKALKEQGIQLKYIRLIKQVYSHSMATIQLEKKSTSFKLGKGVKQGDPMSPKLFLAVLEQIFRKLNWEHLGINVNGTMLTHLRFADDIVLLAKTSEDMSRMINELATESDKAGLKLNPEKTRIMTNGSKNTIQIDQMEINYTDEYIYLGQIITQQEAMQKEVERRVTNGWKRYWGLKEAMKDKELHVNTKIKLFNTCILPVLMYGCQSWTLTREVTSKLATCQYAMERSMLNVKKSDRIRNRVIRNKTKATDITIKIKRLKWRWAGHMMRGADKWCKRVTVWYPREGKRSRGRPQKRWDDDIRQVAGVTWNRVTQERSEWKRLEEAFADWQTDLQKIKKKHIID